MFLTTMGFRAKAIEVWQRTRASAFLLVFPSSVGNSIYIPSIVWLCMITSMCMLRPKSIKVWFEDVVCPKGPTRSPSCSPRRIRRRPGPSSKQPMVHREASQSQQAEKLSCMCNVVHCSLAVERSLNTLLSL